MSPSRLPHWMLLVGVLSGLGAVGLSVRHSATSSQSANPVAANDAPGSAPCEGATACQAKVGQAPAEGGAVVLGHPGLLVFSSESCAACKKMAPVVQAAETSCGQKDDVVHVNVDNDPGQSIASEYNVSSLPSFVSVDAEGHEVGKLTGLQSLEQMQQTFEELRGTRCSLEVPSNVKPL